MEDRDDAGLYLEMTDGPVAAYAETACPEVLALPGAPTGRRGGRTCVRDRTDLPRKLPEFSYLGVYEVDDDVHRRRRRPPASPATTTAAPRGPGRAG